MKNIKLKLFTMIAIMLCMSIQAAPREFAAGTAPISKIVTILNSCLFDFNEEHAQRKFHTYIDEILEIMVKEQNELLHEIAPNTRWPDKKAFLLEFAAKLEGIKHEKDWSAIKKTLTEYFDYVNALKKAFEKHSQLTLLLKFKKRLAIA